MTLSPKPRAVSSILTAPAKTRKSSVRWLFLFCSENRTHGNALSVKKICRWHIFQRKGVSRVLKAKLSVDEQGKLRSNMQILTAPAKKKASAQAGAFFNEINPFRICEMCFAREILLTQCEIRLAACGFILFHRKHKLSISQFAK